MVVERECFECGSKDWLHDHHVVPRSRGGRHTVPLCMECHSKAHHDDRNMAIGKLIEESAESKKSIGKRWCSMPPYGKDLSEDGERFVDNPEESKVISDIMAMRAEGLICQKIADILNGREIKTKNNSTWTASGVSRLARSYGLAKRNSATLKELLAATPKQDHVEPKAKGPVPTICYPFSPLPVRAPAPNMVPPERDMGLKCRNPRRKYKDSD